MAVSSNHRRRKSPVFAKVTVSSTTTRILGEATFIQPVTRILRKLPLCPQRLTLPLSEANCVPHQ
eukprot:15778211-Heterocapsa_arctica.AAC.1